MASSRTLCLALLLFALIALLRPSFIGNELAFARAHQEEGLEPVQDGSDDEQADGFMQDNTDDNGDEFADVNNDEFAEMGDEGQETDGVPEDGVENGEQVAENTVDENGNEVSLEEQHR